MTTALRINPYLNFDGKTEEAFNFYKSVFGGEFSRVERFGAMPGPPGTVPKEEANRIMHIALPVGETVLMGSDTSPSRGHVITQGNNVNLSLHPESLAEAQRLFGALSAGGVMEMPFAKMFWGAWFGSFADKFGIRWMINFEEK